jgi:hypothetical protein
LVDSVENIIKDVYAFYNRSAKRQRRLKELAQKSRATTIEDTAIGTLEETVEKTLEKGTS